MVVTGRNEVVAKVMFLLVSVILSTGGVLPQCMLEYHHPPRRSRTPRIRHPPGSRYPPPLHTVNERPVRILLDCMVVHEKKLVVDYFGQKILTYPQLTVQKHLQENNELLNLTKQLLSILTAVGGGGGAGVRRGGWRCAGGA